VALAATPFLPAGLPVLLALVTVFLLVRDRAPDGKAEDERAQSAVGAR
jgi:hypothetical protein